jgi:uncharacterized protein
VRVVLDTNVIVSSFLTPAGASARIREALRSQVFDLIVSSELLEEYERALAYHKVARVHGMNCTERAEVIEGLREISVLVTVESAPSVIAEDPADDMVLATAAEGDAAYIVSGDRHLQLLGEHRGIVILSPRAFLGVVDSQGDTI